MKPRIFVSSTFYDLKYIREDLANYIKAHDFDSIMFEDGDIGYTPGKPLDKSCYDAMHSSDMALLIIGGNYGSPATGEQSSDFTEYISVTRNEFRTAIKSGIPVFVFIDRKVYSEFEMYEINYDLIENHNGNLNFKNTKNINVFRFIKEIKNIGNLSITEFEKVNDIKEFLGKQWADMFKKYLEILKEKSIETEQTNAVADIRQLTKKMDIMLDSIGKILLKENDVYEKVKNQQEITDIANIISVSMSVEIIHNEQQGHEVERLLEVLKNIIDDELIIPDHEYAFDSNDDKMISIFEEKGFSLVFMLLSQHEINEIKNVLADKNNMPLLIEELYQPSNYSDIFWAI